MSHNLWLHNSLEVGITKGVEENGAKTLLKKLTVDEKDDYNIKHTSLIPRHKRPVTINTKMAAHGSTTISNPGTC